MIFVKEKSVLKITRPNLTKRNVYSLDLATGIMYGVSGKPVKAIPTYAMNEDFDPFSPFDNLVNQFINHIDCMKNDDFLPYLSFAERVASLTVIPPAYIEYRQNRSAYEELSLSKDSIEIYKNYCDNKVNLNIAKKIELIRIKEKYNLSEHRFNLIESLYRVVKNLEFMEYCAVCIGLKNFDFIPGILGFFEDYYNNYKIIGEKWEKSKNFIESYAIVKHKKLLFEDNAKLAKLTANTKLNLAFEYGDFVAIVPTTVDEYRKECDTMNNCIYPNYCTSVMNGRNNIVFIRRKSNIDKPFVDCEISNAYNIGQFLLKSNKRNLSKDTEEFEKKYQEYLNTLKPKKS